VTYREISSSATSIYALGPTIAHKKIPSAQSATKAQKKDFSQCRNGRFVVGSPVVIPRLVGV
jgi:hypothetical protein